MAGKVDYKRLCKVILNECELALDRVSQDEVDAFIQELLCARKVFFIGVGRVLLSLEAFAKRLAHCGVETVVVGQITEPAITDKDLLVVASGSGESLIPVAIAKKSKQLGARLALIGSNPQSTIATIADVFVRIPVKTKLNRLDEIPSSQPMTSLFEQSLLLFGDAIACIIINQKGLEIEKLWQYHANLE